MVAKLFIALLASLFGWAGGLQAAAVAHSTSTSRQFIVYGADVQVRGAMCDLAERTKAALLHTLDLRDRWKTPLVINLEFPQANLPELPPSRLDFSQTGVGLKLQLNLLISDDLNGPEIQRELLRATLVEMIYEARPDVAAGTPYVAPPDWLVDGLLQLAPGRDTKGTSRLLESIVTANKVAPLAEIVAQRRDLLEPASRKVHEAYAMALVQLLIDAPGGRAKLVRYLTDLPDAPNDAMADLQAHFPSVLGSASGKWWSLSVAHLSATDRYEILSAPETAQRLDQLLHFSVPGKDGQPHDYALADFAAYLKLPASRGVLEALGREYLLLGSRAHPSYRPIVQECYQLTQLLARGKTRRMAARLARVATYRTVVESQGQDMDDYLNWFEATQLKTMSGAFSEILKAAADEGTKPPRRRDPISVYLDSIEATL